MIRPVFESSLLARAIREQKIGVDLIQIRDFSDLPHRSVDDAPYGGGAGMILRVDVLHAAWKAATADKPPKHRTILMSPQGRPFDQEKARELAKLEQMTIVCGHYEGVDQRFVDQYVDEEISVGDFIVTGGELPAALLVDGVSRNIGGVVGKSESVQNDTFSDGLLKYPQYTRPSEYNGLPVPKTLQSGDHQRIEAWRQQQSRELTRMKRPDLWEKYRAINKPE